VIHRPRRIPFTAREHLPPVPNAAGVRLLLPRRGASANLGGRVVVITGANSGIGKETALALAGMGATVVMASRDPARGSAAVAEVAAATGSTDLHDLRLDLASLDSIDAFADTVLERFDHLDVLVNNAGLVLGRRRETVDGFEETVGVNHLGPFHLTRRLLDRLVASAPARIVNVTSVAHKGATAGMLLADLQSELSYAQMEAYAKSKLANVLFTAELARRLDGTGVTTNCVHPGIIRSRFARDGDARGWLRLVYPLGAPFMVSSKRGAQTSVFLASAPEIQDVSGAYFVRRHQRLTSPTGRDATAATWLWDESERLLGAAGRAYLPGLGRSTPLEPEVRAGTPPTPGLLGPGGA